MQSQKHVYEFTCIFYMCNKTVCKFHEMTSFRYTSSNMPGKSWKDFFSPASSVAASMPNNVHTSRLIPFVAHAI